MEGGGGGDEGWEGRKWGENVLTGGRGGGGVVWGGGFCGMEVGREGEE